MKCSGEHPTLKPLRLRDVLDAMDKLRFKGSWNELHCDCDWSLESAASRCCAADQNNKKSSVPVYMNLDEAARGISALALPPPQEQNPEPAHP